MRKGSFAQIVVGIRNIQKVRPLRSEKIEADRIDRYRVQRHKNAARPRIVEGRHLPFQFGWRIRAIASKEPIDDKEHGLLAEILMTQIVNERGVTCRAVVFVLEAI